MWILILVRFASSFLFPSSDDLDINVETETKLEFFVLYWRGNEFASLVNSDSLYKVVDHVRV